MKPAQLRRACGDLRSGLQRACTITASEPSSALPRFTGQRCLFRQFGFINAKFKPVISEQLNGMLRAVRTIAATHGVSRAVFIATPANPLRVCGMYRELFSHVASL